MTNSIIDQQLQDIELSAACALQVAGSAEVTLVLELIEGLAQAVRQLATEQQQGWAPVLEEKR